MRRRLIAAASPLAAQYITWIVLFGAVLSLLLTAFESVYYYRSRLESVDTEHQKLFDSYRTSLTDNLWQYDVGQLRLTINGIVTLPTVDAVQLIGEGFELNSGSIPTTEEYVLQSRFAITRDFEGEIRTLGSIILVRYLVPIYWDVAKAVSLRLLVNTIKAILLVAFSLFVFRSLVGSRLAKVAEFLRDVDPLAIEQEPLSLSKNRYKFVKQDELDYIVDALNGMRLELAKNIQTLEHSQSMILRSEKLRIAGEIAAKVSHDVNNALSPALISCRLILSRNRQLVDDETRKSIASVGQSIKDASLIVDQMRPLYAANHKDYSMVDIFDLCEQVSSQANQIHAAGNKAIRVTTTGSSGFVFCSPTDIREILLNLLNNAVDSITNTGEIGFHVSENDKTILLRVSDNGLGMTEEEANSCFDAFFTSKGDGGTGLGLANVQRIVESYRGRIELESEEGVGTTFSIYFPTSGIGDSDGDPWIDSTGK